MQALENPQNGLPDFASLAARVRAERDTLPEPTLPSMEPHEVDSGHEGEAAGSLVAVTLDAPDVSGRSEEHTSELQSLMRISYAVFCLQKKNNMIRTITVAIESSVVPK